MAKERPVDVSAGDVLPLGSRIRLRRQARGTRLSAMAAALGYDRGYLSRVENNLATPSDNLLEKIAVHLEISISELKAAPLDELSQGKMPTGRERGYRTGVIDAPPLPRKKRSMAQRIERLIAMGHLSEEEEEIVEEHLVALVSEVLTLVKAARGLREEKGHG